MLEEQTFEENDYFQKFKIMNFHAGWSDECSYCSNLDIIRHMVIIHVMNLLSVNQTLYLSVAGCRCYLSLTQVAQFQNACLI